MTTEDLPDRPLAPDPATTAATETSPAGTPGPAEGSPAGQALVVRGIFDPAGRELVRLDPATLVPGPARRPPAGTDGRFVLEVSFADGSTTSVPFDALIAADDEAGTAEHGFFEVSAPVDGQVLGVRVLRADGSLVAEVPLER